MNRRLHARLWSNRKLKGELHDDRNKLAILGAIIAEIGLTDYVEARFLEVNSLTSRAIKDLIVTDIMSIGAAATTVPPVLPPSPPNGAYPFFLQVIDDFVADAEAKTNDNPKDTPARHFATGRANGGRQLKGLVETKSREEEG